MTNCDCDDEQGILICSAATVVSVWSFIFR